MDLQDFSNLPFKLKFIHNNRFEKRFIVNEMAKPLEKIINIEDSFLHYLFNTTNDISYKAIYDFHLDEWLKLCDIYKGKKFKSIEFIEDYFPNKYAPIEGNA
jgi:hypothetical protein